ncbi:MAG: hypothetical protein K1X47_07940 [Cyclobacteriaceae bacterium]|nr:hypothetical protein [Cyclobacteriaceae bacterium]
MKTLATFIHTALLLGLTYGSALAQEFKLNRSTGSLVIREVNHVTISGHSGNEIIFRSSRGSAEEDSRAKGLRAISASGLEDNTGLGISVVEKGSTVEVRQLKKMDGPDITILIPAGVSIRYEHNSPYGDDLTISQFSGAVDVSIVHNDVKLDNVTGPITVKAIHSDVTITYNSPPTSPCFTSSEHGAVDVALPVNTSARLTLSTEFGEILVDPAFKIDLAQKDNMTRYNDLIEGQLNSGSTEIKLSSTHSNIYLRKK